MSKFKAYYAIFVIYLTLTITLNALKLDAIWEDPFDEEEPNDTVEVVRKIQNLYDGEKNFQLFKSNFKTPSTPSSTAVNGY